MSREIDHKLSSFFPRSSGSNPGYKKVREEVPYIEKGTPMITNSNRAYFAKVLDC